MENKKYYQVATTEVKEQVSKWMEQNPTAKVTGATVVEIAMGIENPTEATKGYITTQRPKFFKGGATPSVKFVEVGCVDWYCKECGESVEADSKVCHYCDSADIDTMVVELDEEPELIQEPKAKIKAYIRLSHSDRLEANGFQRQKAMIEDQYHVTEWFEDVISGAVKERPQLSAMIEGLEEGDIVVIPAIDRLSRSTVDLLDLVDQIKSKGAVLKSIQEPWLDTSSENPMSEFLLTVMGALNQMERQMIQGRIKKGVEVAKAKGIKFGRPLQNGDKVQHALELYKAGTHSTRQIEKVTGVSRSTLMRRVRELKEAGKM